MRFTLLSSVVTAIWWVVAGAAAALGSTGQADAALGELSVVDESVVVRSTEYVTMVIGELRNDTDLPASGVSVDLVGLSEDCDEVSTWRAWPIYGSTCSYAEAFSQVGCVLPGDRAWFKAVIYQAEVLPAQLRVAARASFMGYEHGELELEVVEPLTVRNLGDRSVVEGVLLNSGATDVVGLVYTVVARDSTGSLLDVTSLLPPGERIGGIGGGVRAGQSIDVVVDVLASADEIAAFELLVGGSEYAGAFYRHAVAGIARQAGTNGSQWRSELTLANRSGAAANVRLRFYAMGETVESVLQLADGEAAHWDDVVGELFEIEEETAGFVRLDSDVPLTITARTLNVVGDGGFGQLLPVITQETTYASAAGGVLAPVRGGDDWRTNLGLVNFSEQSCDVDVQIYDPKGALAVDLGRLRVDANSWRQIGNVVTVSDGYAVVGPVMSCAIWSYASVIDQGTNDPALVALDPIRTRSYDAGRGGGSIVAGWSQ